MTPEQTVWPTRAVGMLVAAAVLGLAAIWAVTWTPGWRTEPGAIVAEAADGTVVRSSVATSGSCPSLLDGLVRGDDDPSGPCTGPPSPLLVLVPAAGAAACAVVGVRWRQREGAVQQGDDSGAGPAAPSARAGGSAAVSLSLGAVAVGLVGAALWAAATPGETQEWMGGAPIAAPGQPAPEPVPVAITQCPSMLDDLLDRGYDSTTCEPGGDPAVVVVGLVGGALVASGAWRARPRVASERASAGV